MNRIKGLRKKLGDNNYDTLIPFGADGNLIDMINTLNLEQELKLGGGHISAIDESGANLVITETYTGGYICTTTIVENLDGSTDITSVLTKTGEEWSKTKTISIPAAPINNVLTIEEELE